MSISMPVSVPMMNFLSQFEQRFLSQMSYRVEAGLPLGGSASTQKCPVIPRDVHDHRIASRCFQQNRAWLLRNYRGGFVLIHNDQVVSVFKAYDDALREGFMRFRGVGFLVREISETDAEPIDMFECADAKSR